MSEGASLLTARGFAVLKRSVPSVVLLTMFLAGLWALNQALDSVVILGRGFVDIPGYPTQVSGRIQPEGKWFYFRLRESASIDIYPPDASPYSAAAEPEWVWWCEVQPDGKRTEQDWAENLVVEFIDLWRRGTPPRE